MRKLLLLLVLAAAGVTAFFVYHHPPMRLMPPPLLFQAGGERVFDIAPAMAGQRDRALLRHQPPPRRPARQPHLLRRPRLAPPPRHRPPPHRRRGDDPRPDPRMDHPHRRLRPPLHPPRAHGRGRHPLRPRRHPPRRPRLARRDRRRPRRQPLPRPPPLRPRRQHHRRARRRPGRACSSTSPAARPSSSSSPGRRRRTSSATPATSAPPSAAPRSSPTSSASSPPAPRAAKIDVFTYSAGATVGSDALALLARETPDTAARLGEVYHAAPDADFRAFVDDLAAYAPHARRVTAAVNLGDSALRLAQAVNRASRAGRPDLAELSADTSARLLAAAADGEIEIVQVHPDRMPELAATSHTFWYDHPWASNDVLLTLLFHLPPATRALDPATAPSGAAYWTFPEDYPARMPAVVDAVRAATAQPPSTSRNSSRIERRKNARGTACECATKCCAGTVSPYFHPI